MYATHARMHMMGAVKLRLSLESNLIDSIESR